MALELCRYRVSKDSPMRLIVGRNLKPENMLLSEDEAAEVCPSG